jgi:(p)ppGpp synthase/HD superfamily hydrolase
VTGERARQMTNRVLREARDRGVPGGLGPLERALATALAHRGTRLPDDHHPALLHPGRTVLILLTDTDERDEEVLAAAALSESLDDALKVSPGTVRREMGDGVTGAWLGIPGAGGDRLHGDGGRGDEILEELVTAPLRLARVALAERLDHLRHLHLEPATPLRARLHADAVAHYLPVAARVDPVLSRRYRWWCDRFARRFLTSVPRTS